ncbi:MAG: translocation/assembly module TamB domain-containing protein [Armatimonadota bacterium]|nr:translocation/assembly module TamB domain-containing protein [Armatimonadota bacterium]
MRWRARSVGWRVAQLLLVIVPATIIGLSGVMYLWQVKLALEESLPPALRAYVRRQAKLDVRVQRVRLYWGGAVLTETEVRTIDGALLMRARAIEARLPTANAPLTVELYRPEVWIARDRRGQWNIEPLLRQPRPPEPVPLTLRVLAQHGTLRYEDLFPQTPVRATISVDELTYSQPSVGAYLRARGTSATLGTLQLDALTDGKRWLAELHARSVDGTVLKPYLPRLPIDLRQAKGDVALQLVYEPQQPLKVQGVARGVARQFTFRNKSLPWHEARFLLTFTEVGLSGEARTPDGTAQAHLQLDWSQSPIRFNGQVRALGEATALWRLFSTEKPSVDGKYTLNARVAGTPDAFQAVGEATLERVRTPQGMLHRVRSPFVFAQGQLYLPALQAEYAGRTLRGRLWLDTRPKTPQVRLFASARRLPLQRILALQETDVRGEADIALIAYGALNDLRLEANLLADALTYNQHSLGGVRARVRYYRDALEVPLIAIQGAVGAIQVSGVVERPFADNPRFDLTVDADELDLNLLATLLGYTEGALAHDEAGKPLRLDGIGYLTAALRGTRQSPQAIVEAVVFDGRLGDIGAEVIIANLNLVGRELRIAELQILRRAAQLIASGVVQLPERADQPPQFRLQGNLYELDLATIPDWLRRELPIAGVASGAFEAVGAPRRFTVNAQLNAETLQFDQTLMREGRVALIARYQEGDVQVEVLSAQAQVAGGQLQVQGSWHSDGAFALKWQLRDAALEAFAPYLPVEYRLTGQATLTGTATGTLQAPTLTAQLVAEQLRLNGVPIGTLEAHAQYTSPEPTAPSVSADASATPTRNGILEGTFTLRTPDGVIRCPKFAYDLAQNVVQLTAETEPLPVEWLRQVANAVPNLVPPAVAERLETLQGRAQAQLRLEGALEQPIATLVLNADAIQWRAQPLGTLSLQAAWQGTADIADLAEASPLERALAIVRRWRTQQATLSELRWQAENARLKARLSYTPDALRADVEIAQLPLRWARLWDPSLPELDGQLDLSLIGTGNPESPELTLSATLSNFKYGDYTIDQILFSQVEWREGVIQTDDALIRVGDYQARLSGRVPFHWSPFGVPDDEPIQVQVRVREQPLMLLGLFAPIDTERTRGTIDAQLEIAGTLSAPQPRGQLQIKGDTLALPDLRTALEDLTVAVEFDGERARIMQAQARSSEGGTVRLEGGILFTGEQPTAALQLVADGFTAVEPKLPVLGTGARAVISGRASITGTLRQPTVQGAFTVQQGFLYLPAELAPSEARAAFPIDPRFEISVQLRDDSVFRNPNIDARLEGTLQIGGSLSEPTLLGEFNIRTGALNLPTARLRIEPDSVARFTYPAANAAGETIARVELDARATTSLVAPDLTGEPTRYRIELSVRGTLDDPKRLQLTAHSEPPGLSEQTILTLLGRGQALTALARGADPAQVLREQLSEIFTAHVLPELLAPLEAGIAEALGLELFTVDYTGLRPTSVYLVKSLFNGFGITYRRGIGIAEDEYQVRLFYRLPLRNRLLQRLRVGFGFDHTQTRFFFIEGSLLFR